MTTITYVEANGTRHVQDVPVGHSVMQGAVDNGIDGILAECGGNAQCATCHVYVEEKYLPLLQRTTEAEAAMLENTAEPRRPNSRLSCQITVTGELEGLVVQLPETQV